MYLAAHLWECCNLSYGLETLPSLMVCRQSQPWPFMHRFIHLLANSSFIHRFATFSVISNLKAVWHPALHSASFIWKFLREVFGSNRFLRSAHLSTKHKLDFPFYIPYITVSFNWTPSALFGDGPDPNTATIHPRPPHSQGYRAHTWIHSSIQMSTSTQWKESLPSTQIFPLKKPTTTQFVGVRTFLSGNN